MSARHVAYEVAPPERRAMVGIAAAACLFLAVLLAAGHQHGGSILGQRDSLRVQISSAVEADLDGDGRAERVKLAPGRDGIRIDDGPLTYASRPKWDVFAAELGDTDRNDLTEVVALLDSSDGRHLALIGWHAGRYAERLVSSALSPVPLQLKIRQEGSGDLIELVEIAPPDASPSTPTSSGSTTYRWDGFGFLAVAGRGAQ